jgi:hypothetical protein
MHGKWLMLGDRDDKEKGDENDIMIIVMMTVR